MSWTADALVGRAALALALMAASCAPATSTLPVDAPAQGVEVINVFLDDSADATCSTRIGASVKLEKSDQDSLLVRFVSSCATAARLVISPAQGLPLSCNGASAGTATVLSVASQSREYLDCTVDYSAQAEYAVRLRETRRVLGSELALEEVP